MTTLFRSKHDDLLNSPNSFRRLNSKTTICSTVDGEDTGRASPGRRSSAVMQVNPREDADFEVGFALGIRNSNLQKG